MLGNIDGQMIVDENEERVAVIAPTKPKNRDSIERVIKQNFDEILTRTRIPGNSLNSWVSYPEEGKTFPDLLKALLARAGVNKGGLPPQCRGR